MVTLQHIKVELHHCQQHKNTYNRLFAVIAPKETCSRVLMRHFRWMQLPADYLITMVTLMTCWPSASSSLCLHSLFTANLGGILLIGLSASFVLSNSNDPTCHSSGWTHDKLIKHCSEWQERRGELDKRRGWKKGVGAEEEEKGDREIWFRRREKSLKQPQCLCTCQCLLVNRDVIQLMHNATTDIMLLCYLYM